MESYGPFPDFGVPFGFKAFVAFGDLAIFFDLPATFAFLAFVFLPFFAAAAFAGFATFRPVLFGRPYSFVI